MFHTAGIADGLTDGRGKGIEKDEQTVAPTTATGVALKAGRLVFVTTQLTFKAVPFVEPGNKLVLGDHQYIVIYKNWHFYNRLTLVQFPASIRE